jgi:8-oxo-dGTP diphosphatase
MTDDSPTTSVSGDGRNRSKPVLRGVIGVMERDGAYLMVKRAPGLVMGGTWCFPGGHLERGENARMAVCRELEEELGIKVEAVERLGSLRLLRWRHARYILAVWRVRHVEGAFNLNEDEVANMRWARPGDVINMSPGLESNLEVLAMLGH